MATCISSSTVLTRGLRPRGSQLKCGVWSTSTGWWSRSRLLTATTGRLKTSSPEGTLHNNQQRLVQEYRHQPLLPRRRKWISRLRRSSLQTLIRLEFQLFCFKFNSNSILRKYFLISRNAYFQPDDNRLLFHPQCGTHATVINGGITSHRFGH